MVTIAGARLWLARALNAGKWNHAQSHTDKNRARLERKPRTDAPSTVDQKVKYAHSLSDDGNLSKGNSIINKELIPAIDESRVQKLQDKHPVKLLNLNQEHWPREDNIAAYWSSLAGQAALDKQSRRFVSRTHTHTHTHMHTHSLSLTHTQPHTHNHTHTHNLTHIYSHVRESDRPHEGLEKMIPLFHIRNPLVSLLIPEKR